LLLKWRGLNDCETQNRFRQRFERAGLSRDRLLFEGASEHEDMLQRYLGVDVALDPFPFCGGLTTCEALWMGTPVVTLPGDRPVSRQSLSILQAMGRREWAVASEEDYIRVALALADDAASRSQLRKSLPKEMLGSALCDHPRAARNLERIYRDAWRRWLRSPL
jgi:predicted O-linked N-acetylglucosamine transferase (SPINDLY family)